MGSIPVGDSEFFFVPCSCHVEYFIFMIAQFWHTGSMLTTNLSSNKTYHLSLVSVTRLLVPPSCCSTGLDCFSSSESYGFYTFWRLLYVSSFFIWYHGCYWVWGSVLCFLISYLISRMLLNLGLFYVSACLTWYHGCYWVWGCSMFPNFELDIAETIEVRAALCLTRNKIQRAATNITRVLRMVWK